jgi:histidine triad (HIT) family protein
MTTGCVFCKILSSELAAHFVERTPTHAVFLDKSPLFRGHCLVVPARHLDTISDVPPDQVGSLFGVVQRVARAVERGLGADGTLVAVNNRVSQSVPHLHVHVIPRHKKDGLRGFFWPRQKYASDDEMADFARRIASGLEG